MTQVSQDHITPDHKVAIEQTASEICRRGLRVPALAVLGSGPLIPYLSSQLLWIAQPALSLFIPSHNIRQAAELLEKPEALTILAGYLHENDDTRDN